MRKIFGVVILLLCFTPAEAAYLDLAWNPNIEPDLAGYQLYLGTASGVYTDSIDVGNSTSYRLDGLLDGVTYYIALTAYDTVGNESDFSDEVSGVGVASGGSDTDGDGLADDWEIDYFGDLSQKPDADYDGDAASNMAEYQHGTDPTNQDSDSDQIPDGWEIQYGLDPLDASDANADSDGDGLTNLEEYLRGTNPTNAPPTANAGLDQTVDEGSTVTLDGFDSYDPDDGIVSYLWEQTSGISVILSDPRVPSPAFVTPPVDAGGMLLSFRLTISDRGGLQSSDETSVTVEDNGITGFPDDVITTTTSTGENFGIKVESGGAVISLQAIDPSAIADTKKRPKHIGFGLVGIQLKTDTIGGAATVKFYLPAPASSRYKWYKYHSSTGWKNYSRHAVFNPTRDQVTVTLVDGGAGDDDGLANGVIVDPSGLGTDPASSGGESSTSGGTVVGSDGGGGCFIRRAFSSSLQENNPQSRYK